MTLGRLIACVAQIKCCESSCGSASRAIRGAIRQCLNPEVGWGRGPGAFSRGAIRGKGFRDRDRKYSDTILHAEPVSPGAPHPEYPLKKTNCYQYQSELPLGGDDAYSLEAMNSVWIVEWIVKLWNQVGGARWRLRVLLAIAVGGLLGGCSSHSSDRTRTQTEGTAAGAAVGMGAGAVAAGDDSDSRKKGAMAGATAGGMAGATYGTSVANKKEGYIRTEDDLDKRLARIRKESAEQRRYNEKLTAEIERRERQLAEIQKESASWRNTFRKNRLRREVASEVERVDSEARVWQNAIDEHKGVLKHLAERRQAKELEKGIDQLNTGREELLREREELSAIGEKVAE